MHDREGERERERRRRKDTPVVGSKSLADSEVANFIISWIESPANTSTHFLKEFSFFFSVFLILPP
jgi:hypothetical protein